MKGDRFVTFLRGYVAVTLNNNGLMHSGQEVLYGITS